ncbi:MAG TPA: hypothetical protein EYQ61_10080 [Dehalococcoidia bacterium]|jgi:hypothetical protein|nr:hypothetical protein [Dehalococcoidia bacterium]
MLTNSIWAEKRTLLVLVTAVLMATVAAACGSDSGASGGSAVARVIASERIYTLEDFEALRPSGVKTVKDYDTEDLPAALDVVQAVFNQLAYEVRFYSSHADAVAEGTVYAESITGEDAVVTGDEVLWEEGERDRRKCSRAAQTPHSSCSYSARYLEYVIRGNMILFCEGDESPDAFENCENLLTLLEPA